MVGGLAKAAAAKTTSNRRRWSHPSPGNESNLLCPTNGFRFLSLELLARRWPFDLNDDSLLRSPRSPHWWPIPSESGIIRLYSRRGFVLWGRSLNKQKWGIGGSYETLRGSYESRCFLFESGSEQLKSSLMFVEANIADKETPHPNPNRF